MSYHTEQAGTCGTGLVAHAAYLAFLFLKASWCKWTNSFFLSRCLFFLFFFFFFFLGGCEVSVFIAYVVTWLDWVRMPPHLTPFAEAAPYSLALLGDAMLLIAYYLLPTPHSRWERVRRTEERCPRLRRVLSLSVKDGGQAAE